MSNDKIENSKEQKPVSVEYNRNGKYLNIRMPASLLRVKSAFVGGKNTPIVTFVDPKYPDKDLWVIGVGKVGMLADYLGIQRNELRNLIANKDADYRLTELNNMLKNQADRIITISASEYTTEYLNRKTVNMGVFNIATEQHHIVTFTEVRECVQNTIGEVIETSFERSLIWEKQIKAFETAADKFDVKIRVTSGRNIKTSAIKVIVYIRVGSCNNTAIAANYTSIKHTAGWKERLVKTLGYAMEMSKTAQNVIELGCKRALTYEDGINYINNKLKVSITTVENIQRLKDALIERFKFEYGKQKTAFALSQALSFAGTHFLADQLSDRTLEMLSEQSFDVLRNFQI